MKITFLGTGEAFGKKEHTSILINDEILLECGLHTLMQLMKIKKMGIKVIYISHFHADHALGLPSFLLALNEEGRKERLTIIGPKGMENYVKESLNLSYRKKLENLDYGLEIKEVKNEMNMRMLDYIFSFGKMKHSFECYSISIARDKKISYTGDGEPTIKAMNNMKQSDMPIAEAYGIGKNHSSIIKAAELAKELGVKLLALVHIFRKVNIDKEMRKAEKIFTPIILPKEFDEIWI